MQLKSEFKVWIAFLQQSAQEVTITHRSYQGLLGLFQLEKGLDLYLISLQFSNQVISGCVHISLIIEADLLVLWFLWNSSSFYCTSMTLQKETFTLKVLQLVHEP